MINNIIFDFGDVFINLNKQATLSKLQALGIKEVTPKMIQINEAYETGDISTDSFIAFYKKLLPSCSSEQLIAIWNAIILDFPEYRLEFLEQLCQLKKYRLFLLSNTNHLHIQYVIQTMGKERYNRFKNCFEQFYLSHEIGLRKPNQEVYNFVLSTNKLDTAQTLFIDDTTENTEAAKSLGLKTWNINPLKEDVIQLPEYLKQLNE